MSQTAYSGLAISDFNLDNFAGYLNHDPNAPTVEMVVAPYGQVASLVVDPQSNYWNHPYDFILVWTQPQSVIPSFNEVLQFKTTPIQQLLSEVDDYAALLLQLQDRANMVFVPTWVLPPHYRGFGMLDMKHEFGVTNLLMRMNLRLAEHFEQAPHVYPFHAERWMASAGIKAFNPKLWYMAKVPFGNDVFKTAVKDVKAALRGIAGQAKKLVVVDLDDTLWGDIVGDVGWEQIRLGGHDPVGEAHVDFQRALKALTHKGILLGIVSKNEEEVALEAIERHPEMVLKADDFAAWRINWNDKAQNIVDLVDELNLGTQSVVFIDDNPIERARVREALPEVFVPEWPEDKLLYQKALLDLDCFDVPSISQEDIARNEMYKVEKQREQLKRQLSSLDDWLMTIDMQVKIEELNETNLARTTQLFNKTNQLNLSTRRMSEAELVDWAAADHRKLWTCRVSDKFGDLGLVGIISFETHQRQGSIVDFVLSCRAMGRKVEETMVYTVLEHAKSLDIDEVRATYLPTAKNKPCLDFWKRSGFSCDETSQTFTWNILKDYPLSPHLTLETSVTQAV